jgi:hypothetical protein
MPTRRFVLAGISAKKQSAPNQLWLVGRLFYSGKKWGGRNGADLGGWSDEQRLHRGLDLDGRHSHIGEVAAGNIGKDAIGGVFGAGAADVEALDSLDGQRRQQEAIGNTNPRGINKFRAHIAS